MRRHLTTEKIILRAKAFHGAKYDYTLTRYEGHEVKIKIICPEHGVFEQVPHSHLRGRGCQKCAVEKIRSSAKKFLLKAKAAHGTTYDYELVQYKNTTTKIKIICPEHGVFEQKAGSHIEGRGCPKCAYENRWLGIEKFIFKANSVHVGLYDYSRSQYKGAHTKIEIRCPKHGLFKQNPNSHLNGKGCPDCAEFGFKVSKTGYLYILRSIDRAFLKVGITNNFDQRRSSLIRVTPFGFDVLGAYAMAGKAVLAIETYIKRGNINAGLTGFEGASEWFPYSQKLERDIKELVFQG